MQNGFFRKGLVCAIFLLFVGLSAMPLAGSLSVEKHSSMIGSVKELNSVAKTESRGINVTLDGPKGENGWFVGPVHIVITPDNGTEIELVLCRIDGGSWQTCTEPIIVVVDGIHLLELKIYDTEGNEWYFSFIIKIDMWLPTIELQKEKMFLNKIKFIADVSDVTSGVWRVEFYLDDELRFTDYDSPFEWIWKGTEKHTVTAKVFDWAGHSASSSISILYVQSQSSSSVQQNSQNLQINQLIQNLILRHQMTNR